MILLIPLIITFIGIWILGFLGHEFCHGIEGIRQGSSSANISVTTYKGIPSMLCTCNKISNRKMFAYAGGLYSGIIYLLIGLLTFPAINTYAFPLIFSFITLGIINLIYCSYEGQFLYKWTRGKYMFYHYIIYGLGLLLSIGLFWKWIINYINLW